MITMVKRRINIFRFLIFIVMLSTVAGYFYYSSSLKAVSTTAAAERQIIIPKGSNLRAVSSILEKEKLIKDSLVFELYCKLNDKSEGIKAGKYSIKTSMGVPEIIEVISNSSNAIVDTIKFTIPEGYNLKQIVDKINNLGVVSPESIQAALKADKYDYEFLEQIPERENRLEGYLFPDTYEIYRDTTAEAVIKKLLGRFDDVFTEEFRKRAEELNMSIDQVVILASIIEREARLDKERKTISGVFHNRLKKKMLLQSCATVQYLLKEPKEELLYEDLEIDSPYNTYKYAGLPPGPIASPGLAAIEATLYPEDTDLLYFFALDDGSHIFTKTYDEHINAQNKYR